MNSNTGDGYGSFWWWLNVVANYLQVLNYEMNVKQLSNDDLMKHLLEQDKVLDMQNNILDKQTNDYLEKIVKQNEKIIDLLERR